MHAAGLDVHRHAVEGGEVAEALREVEGVEGERAFDGGSGVERGGHG